MSERGDRLFYAVAETIDALDEAPEPQDAAYRVAFDAAATLAGLSDEQFLNLFVGRLRLVTLLMLAVDSGYARGAGR